MLTGAGVDARDPHRPHLESVARRARDLGIARVHQGAHDKLAVFGTLCSRARPRPRRRRVHGRRRRRPAGAAPLRVALTVPDAPEIVRRHAHHVTRASGGRGAVREACELISCAQDGLDGAARALASAMTGRSAAWFPVAFLVLVASLTWWVEQTHAGKRLRPRRRQARHDAGLDRRQTLATRLAPDGGPLDTVTSRHVVHFPDDDRACSRTRRWSSFGKGAPVTANARSATSEGRGDNIHLNEDVRLTRAAYRAGGRERSELMLLDELPAGHPGAPPRQPRTAP